MGTGKQVRLNRLFAHPSGNILGVAVDHFINYRVGSMEPAIRSVGKTLPEIVKGHPDAITMHRGVAANIWGRYAGSVPMILQCAIIRPDDSCREYIADPEDAVRLGADAFAISAFTRGDSEAMYMRRIADTVKAAERFDMPVITHIYPRRFENGGVEISFEPEDVAWAVHCAMECGVDIIKAPYCNDVKAFAEIVSDCPVPLVAAGGPKCETLRDSLAMQADVMKAGARGATVGRNIWGFPNIVGAVKAFKAVIHDGATADDAMASAGL